VAFFKVCLTFWKLVSNSSKVVTVHREAFKKVFHSNLDEKHRYFDRSFQNLHTCCNGACGLGSTRVLVASGLRSKVTACDRNVEIDPLVLAVSLETFMASETLVLQTSLIKTTGHFDIVVTLKAINITAEYSITVVKAFRVNLECL
jgi:hypothetical protein